ncbi:sigma-70 family RNA polymerase sigma factor [Roseibium aggregatum]|uniref:Sigma-70 family RNA polymerase sigma factor n=1 Tax=Roseibium aggregatum TaxID=187304 RepID=A0A939EHY9_9HYPH|nr:sigma-70 family RNA polymerase sigma factor [Roseibium aggregatum]MBN9672070.1 sigma-70 family RNA polymerase sigma factor [Roseibium aggregatum]
MPDRSQRLLRETEVLHRYAVTLTRDRSDAEDLVQDCMERALRKWTLRQSSVPLRPWLFRMMRNLHVSRWRRTKKHDNQVPLDEMEAPPQVPAAQEGSAELNRLLTRMLNLPAEQREALHLVGIEGCTYAEAAEILGVAEGTIMSRISRARASLRQDSSKARRPQLRSVT